ncbi:hypothetical protein ACFOGI_00030 [Virgibacillus xinjiangensis]|uniref:Fur-regulated basic protein A n=1 Tax=Virgibacillus xinjiangensis TaxID=393090 RepID=A0ABV7CQR4_9BACI
MKSFIHLYEETQEELGRKLRKDEYEFLEWMYERYIEEKMDTEKIS